MPVDKGGLTPVGMLGLIPGQFIGSIGNQVRANMRDKGIKPSKRGVKSIGQTKK